MNFLDKLERKFGRFAIANLMLYIMGGQAIVLLTSFLTQSSLLKQFLYFDPSLILKGQIWRLVTFVFIPNSSSSLFFFIFTAFLYYSIGLTLEHEWGVFKFNMYYLLGMVFNILGLLIVQFIFFRTLGLSDFISGFYYACASNVTVYLNLSLFLAYAALFPDVQFLLYMIIPIKTKYLAFIDILLLAYQFITGTAVDRILIVLALLNFFIFFGRKLLHYRPSATSRQFKAAQRELKQGPPIKVAFHKCTVCGKTELTDPDMEFRYCSKCNGNYEYCMEHLHNHEHIQ